MVGAPAARLPHAPALDGVRGLAVAAVVVFHCGASGWLPGGFLGVSLFFTLSGYLITSLILSEVDQNGALALGAFWARRVRRLVPAMLLTLLAVLILRLVIELPERTTAEVIGGLTYSSNWIAMGQQASYSDLFSAPSALAHLWSLAIEEQIYIAVPLLVWVVCRRHPTALRKALGLAAAAAIAASVGFALIAGDHDTVYYGTHTRMGELAAGILLALAVPFGRARRSRWATLAGVGGLGTHLAMWRIVGVNDGWLYAGGLTACALASLAMIDSAMRPGPIAGLFNLPVLRWLGRISYGLYLFHWPVTVVISPVRFDLDPVGLFVTRVGVSLCLAAISADWLESPIRKKHDVRPARLVGVSMSGLFGVGALVAVVFGVTVAPSASPSPSVRVLPAGSASQQQASAAGVPREAHMGSGAAAAFDDLELDRPVRVAMFGDSVPNWLIRDGLAALRSRSIELIDGTIEGCDGAVGMPVGRSGNGDELPVMDNCPAWNRWYGKVLDEPADVAVVSIGQGVVVDRKFRDEWFGPCDATFVDWYRTDVANRLRSLSEGAADVVLVLPAWATDQSLWINPADHLARMACVRQTLQAAADLVNAASGDESTDGRTLRADSAVATANDSGADPTGPRVVDDSVAADGNARTRDAVRIIDLAQHICPDGSRACRPVRTKDGVHIDENDAEAVLGWLLDEVIAQRSSDA